MSEVPNPWAEDNWNLTAQGAYIKKYGVSVAQRKARQAGSYLGALKPEPVPAVVRNFIMIKKIGSADPGGAQGTSGSGPPV